jgi:ABC-2 type transport system permease protein
MAERTGRASWLAQIGAIARRDLIIEFSYRFQFVLRLVSAVVLTLTLYYTSRLVQHPAQLRRYGGDYFAFVLVGMVVLSFVTLGVGAFSRSISEQQRAGTLEVLLASPASLSLVLLGSLVVPLGLTMLQVLLYVIAGVIAGVHVHVLGVLLGLVMLVLLLASFAAFGMVSAGFIILVQRGDPFIVLANQATTFLAGTLFPVSLLPLPARLLARAVPAYYALDGIRRSLLAGAGLASVSVDLIVLAGFVIVLVPLALGFLSWAVQAARRAGTLGTY